MFDVQCVQYVQHQCAYVHLYRLIVASQYETNSPADTEELTTLYDSEDYTVFNIIESTAAFRACPKSARRSSICSIPMERRTILSDMPVRSAY